jgi:hypothetical protein
MYLNYLESTKQWKSKNDHTKVDPEIIILKKAEPKIKSHVAISVWPQ